jgi:hypothetical protein
MGVDWREREEVLDSGILRTDNLCYIYFPLGKVALQKLKASIFVA